ncbi:hypothetical protein, partial [Klebsiella pneumoniae]|uniref:hypothetical protein n=1 Tax=Klebsiella pneumoniae TaxID=573 RepID=UPI001CA47D53
QGLIGADIALEIPAIPINAQLFSMPIHQVMVMPGSVMTIPGMRLPFTSIVPFVVYYGPVELPQSTLTLPTVTITVGGPTTTIDGNLTGMVGGVSIPIHIPINIDAGVVTLQGFSIVAAENNIDFTPIIIPTINITLP